jgi:uncharacterized membrane protein YeaQ/YmgE (transglycosylase-associated protein family)
MSDHSVCAASGVIGGTMCSVLANIHSHGVLETVVLAVIGAVVSFAVSAVLEWIRKKLRS